MINNNWVFGNQARIDFTGVSLLAPNIINGVLINQPEGCASISDNSGNLLFYTDGQTVWDNTNTPSPVVLGGNPSSTSSAIILPVPGTPNQYYIFCVDSVLLGGGTDGLSVNTVTVQNIGGITVSVATNLATPTSEKVCSTIKDNCVDFWLVTCGRGDNNFFVYDITNSGITQLPVQNPAGSPNIGVYGYMKFSKSGRYLAVANSETNIATTSVEMYFFDKSTGTISFLYTILIPPTAQVNWKGVYGLEFSDNERYLYFSHIILSGASPSTTSEIYQYDLLLRNYVNTNNPIASFNGSFGALQIAPDNGSGIVDKPIYITKRGSSNLDAILNPNNSFPSNNYTSNQINLGAATTDAGLPTLVQTGNCSFCDCNDCHGCNKDAEKQNEELIDRAKAKFNIEKSDTICDDPVLDNCENSAINTQVDLSPCFYFHWGDGLNDQIEEHDTEVFYLTVCNKYNDIQYNGLRITKVTLVPNIHPIDKIQIVPDRFICFDCLEPCSCQTREFAMITRANDTAGNYTLEVEYCYDEIVITSSSASGKVDFPVEITED